MYSSSKLVAAVMATIFGSASCFMFSPAIGGRSPVTRISRVAYPPVLHAQSMDGENLRPDAAEVLEKMSTQATGRIEQLVNDNKVMLFMKGNKMFPQCGFSNTAIQVLRALNVEFETFDVLSDEAVREKIKEYSNWPTIPQLYVDGEFTGGSDIMIESFQSGELKKTLEGSGAKFLPSG